MCWPIVTLYGSFYLAWTEDDARRNNKRFYLLIIYLIIQINQSKISIFLITMYIHVWHMFVGQFGHEKHAPGVIFSIRPIPDRLWPKIDQINQHYRFF